MGRQAGASGSKSSLEVPERGFESPGLGKGCKALEELAGLSLL